MTAPANPTELVRVLREASEALATHTEQQSAELGRVRNASERRVAFLAAAARDPRLRGGTLKGLVFLTAELDWTEFRHIKASWLARALRKNSRRNAATMLRILVQFGYLEKGPPEQSGARVWNSYRLARLPE